jgi:diadenosine tetraphosphate (Ap4A) HIT family hydrolase
MQKINCPFCPVDPKVNKILFTTSKFYFIQNNKPILKGHCMLIPIRHIREEHELIKSEWDNYRIAFKKAAKYMSKFGGYMTFKNAADDQSVFHLHRHFLPKGFGVHGVDTALRSFLSNK